MTALDACEDFFSFICGVLRTSALGGEVEYEHLRSSVLKELERVESRAFESRMGERWKDIKLILTFFVDSLISESNMKVADKWANNRLAYTLEKEELAGDEKFYHTFLEVWEQKQAASDEILAVIYSCFALGFQGQPPAGALENSLNRKFTQMSPEEIPTSLMNIIKPRIEHFILETSMPIVTENKLFINKTDLRTPASRTIFYVGLITFGLFIALLFLNNLLYSSYMSDIENALKQILSK